ncbi:hypothetical protein AB0M45_21940 [Nocardia sp. NPDC051787]|uniref:hypothetical protein n=1 Tax=Nocardia sp. NPDC051787 TaxID=3155415 RepID=UPI00343E0000
MKIGDCGYFRKGQANRPPDLEHRSCTHPEAALVVVGKSLNVDCPDSRFSWSAGRKPGTKRRYVCTHLNAQVGDCFSNVKYGEGHLFEIRKVPCTTPRAFQVNTRVESDDIGVCKPVRSKYRETIDIAHKQPPVSFCLHRVGT